MLSGQMTPRNTADTVAPHEITAIINPEKQSDYTRPKKMIVFELKLQLRNHPHPPPHEATAAHTLTSLWEVSTVV